MTVPSLVKGRPVPATLLGSLLGLTLRKKGSITLTDTVPDAELEEARAHIQLLAASTPLDGCLLPAYFTCTHIQTLMMGMVNWPGQGIAGIFGTESFGSYPTQTCALKFTRLALLD